MYVESSNLDQFTSVNLPPGVDEYSA